MMNPYQQYKNNSVLTASPGEITLMLYNGAIKFCNQAAEAIEHNDVQGKHNYLIRAQDIIEELDVTLDNKYPIAKEMKLLYEYIKRLLIEVNITKDLEKLNEATELIREFRDAWQEAIKVKKTV